MLWLLLDFLELSGCPRDVRFSLKIDQVGLYGPSCSKSRWKETSLSSYDTSRSLSTLFVCGTITRWHREDAQKLEYYAWKRGRFFSARTVTHFCESWPTCRIARVRKNSMLLSCHSSRLLPASCLRCSRHLTTKNTENSRWTTESSWDYFCHFARQCATIQHSQQFGLCCCIVISFRSLCCRNGDGPKAISWLETKLYFFIDISGLQL